MYNCIERQVKCRRESQAARKVTISVLALDEGAPDFFFMKEASITIILRFLLHAVTCPSRALFLFPFFSRYTTGIHPNATTINQKVKGSGSRCGALGWKKKKKRGRKERRGRPRPSLQKKKRSKGEKGLCETLTFCFSLPAAERRKKSTRHWNTTRRKRRENQQQRHRKRK